MIYLVLISLIVTIFYMVRLFLLKKEIGKITTQLQSYTNRKNDKKVDMALIDKDIEKLGVEINKVIDLYVAENRKRIQFEMEQKQLIANMSHDLRTPLTSILGYIQMAEDQAISTNEREKFLTIAKERANRLEILLKEFFDLSVIESSDYTLKLKRINLRNILMDTLISFYERFQEKSLEPTIHLPDEDIFIMADESAVQRVIENLLSNAVKHSNGKIKVLLETEESTAKLIISNNVQSITVKDVERMFDRFYKRDQSRTSNSTGLGLSIVKSLMDKMNGTIDNQLKDDNLSITCKWKTIRMR
ncbi:sensor histidine kinase [Pseudogracilibacillus sp. ICA-222130]|uniref:sensor histidine kinase n=1 Tax=Pseudogracilibacillus sp. ICA-222130 TaxID=3134655 RepID=UPI0030C52C85